GTDPKGTWSLFIVDDTPPDGGSITNGCNLIITTTCPTISAIGPQTTPEDTPLTVPFTTSAGTLTITTAASSTPTNLLTSLTVGGTGTARTLLITPASNLSDTKGIPVSSSDGTCSNAASFWIKETPVNDPPVIVPPLTNVS